MDSAPFRHPHPLTPLATYRIQFHAGFRFTDAVPILDYLEQLGVGALYASPLAAARAGSMHGYDVVDPTRLNPEIGSETEFDELTGGLARRRMGLILDIVPNHMSVADSANRWWRHVLEFGRESPYAKYFDIDWTPPKVELHGKVLLPILGDQYGRVLDAHGIRLDVDGGVPVIGVNQTTLPINLAGWSMLIAAATDDRSAARLPQWDELLAEMPASESASQYEARRDQLVDLLARDQSVRQATDSYFERLNRAEPGSADMLQLEALLDAQFYRLCSWRVAADEVNYRRFFDVHELAAIRVEDAAVFADVHALPLKWLRAGKITGLRIDHVDGLRDPRAYLDELTSRGDNPYVLVEKILVGAERLREDWPVAGTTGYDALTQLDRVFTPADGFTALRHAYLTFTGAPASFREVTYQAKKLELDAAFASELTALARRLDHLSESHRYWRDFTFKAIYDALTEVVAYFPVYRSYITGDTAPTDNDVKQVDTAIAEAIRRNPAMDRSVFDFVRQVLLNESLPELSDAALAERVEIVLRFQQLTSPVTAKGVEDTAFYRWFPLASLDEVGGTADGRAFGLDGFHSLNAERRRLWPGSMVATSTHDTKRSEDLRARIRTIAEVPERWAQLVQSWHDINQAGFGADLDGLMPDANTEYLIYQTLFGVWPIGLADGEPFPEELRTRLHAYLEKAMREAKQRTSWVRPDVEFESAVHRALDSIVDPTNTVFRSQMNALVTELLAPAHWGALAALTLKTTMPGIPDFYQGNEVWQYRLVDPDNRAAVDHARCSALLDEIQRMPCAEMLELIAQRPHDDRVKLWLTHKLLRTRADMSEVFRSGDYAPVMAQGPLANHVVAFVRRHADRAVLVAVARFFARLNQGNWPVGEVWRETTLPLSLSGATLINRLTGTRWTSDQAAMLPVEVIFADLPFAVYEIA